MNIYVASSWRNERQQDVVKKLRAIGHEVYDFREADSAFNWREIAWKPLSPVSDFPAALQHPISRKAFDADMAALRRADACVLLLPCGLSAHLEAGWAAGSGRSLVVLLGESDARPFEPELMYSMAELVTADLDDVLAWARKTFEEPPF